MERILLVHNTIVSISLCTKVIYFHTFIYEKKTMLRMVILYFELI